MFDVVTNEKMREKTGKHYSYLLEFFKPSILKNRQFCEEVWKKTEELVKLTPEERINWGIRISWRMYKYTILYEIIWEKWHEKIYNLYSRIGPKVN